MGTLGGRDHEDDGGSEESRSGLIDYDLRSDIQSKADHRALMRSSSYHIQYSVVLILMKKRLNQ